MSTQAQYASIPKLGKITLAVANALRDGTGAMGTLLTASPAVQSGTRIDKIQMQALGDTTAGMLRFFLVKGAPGAPISSITFSDVTATVTTTGAHGLATGDLLTVQNAMPDQYNVTNVAVTVTAATTFTYTMPMAPTVAARAVGAFSTIKAAEVPSLWRETRVTAATVVPRTIATITFSTTTATVTTATPHGLTTGDTVMISGATPTLYNGSFTITVTTPSAFTYVMTASPGANAAVVGAYLVIKEAFSKSFYSQSSLDAGYLPLVLPAGWQLRVSTNNAEAFNVNATFAGDLQ
jgi:hypothetical protein